VRPSSLVRTLTQIASRAFADGKEAQSATLKKGDARKEYTSGFSASFIFHLIKMPFAAKILDEAVAFFVKVVYNTTI
jgi:hypothetical protein